MKKIILIIYVMLTLFTFNIFADVYKILAVNTNTGILRNSIDITVTNFWTFKNLTVNSNAIVSGSITSSNGFFGSAYNMTNFPPNIVTTNSIPGPGCTDFGTATTLNINGGTVAYTASPSNVFTIIISNTAPRYVYSLEVLSTNSYTLSAGMSLKGTHVITGTNILTFAPGTGTLWRVFARGL